MNSSLISILGQRMGGDRKEAIQREKGEEEEGEGRSGRGWGDRRERGGECER